MIDYNCTRALQTLAQARPNHPAVVTLDPKGGRTTLTLAELEARSAGFAVGLRRAGLRPGQRMLILAQPDEYFIPFLFGLLRAGGVAVFIDPGRPKAELLGCIRTAQPTALLAQPLLQAAAGFFLPLSLHVIPSGVFPGALRLPDLAKTAPVGSFKPAPGGDSEAVVIFTTGSTGTPKGVIYTHSTLENQLQAVTASLALSKDEVGLFGHSVMMLIGLMAGASVFVSSELDRSPDQVEPARLVALLNESKATITFAAPVLSTKLQIYCTRNSITFPHLRKLMVGGAEINPARIAALGKLMPGGDVYISLGSTEVMPVATIRGQEALARQAGHPTGAACVGFAAPRHELRVIPIRDEAIPAWSEELALPPGTVGEIIIRGPAVTAAYLALPEQTRLAKIADGAGFWHRMGDLGQLDPDGCLWLYGRKSQRVETAQGTLYTLLCEAVFNAHPEVVRCALVGIGPRGQQKAVIIIELQARPYPPTASHQAKLIAELRALGQANPHTAAITLFVIYPGFFPVDIRHNSKIGRDRLAAWAALSSTPLVNADHSA